MKLTTSLAASLVLATACAEPKTGHDLDGPGMADPAPTTKASESPAVSATAVETAVATASASALAEPPPPAMTPEQKFWSEIAMAYNSKLEACKSGWTGDATVTVKKGKITNFNLIDAPTSKGAASVIGLAIPTVPAELEKHISKPFTVSVCTATARLGTPE